MPTVAAVVPHWNRRDLLASLLASLREQTRPFDEIIVVDNGSSDDSVALAEAAGARVIQLDQNLGFAPAVNRGVRATQADLVAVLNNDVTLDPGWLENLLAAVEDPTAHFATGKILQAGNTGVIDGSFDEISRGGCAQRCGAGKLDGPTWNRPREIRMAPMTAALFRRSLWEEVGALDESFGSYLEDVDFGLRCALAGKSGRYVPSAVAYHRGSSTLGVWNKETVWRIARNQVLLVSKHFGGQPRLPILAGQLLWGLVALRHGRGWAFVRGKWAGLQSARKISVSVSDKSRNTVQQVLDASERSIFELERETGFDRYWRAYFWLLRR